MVKTALKLLLVFVEYTESNATLLIKAVNVVDAKRGKHYTDVGDVEVNTCRQRELPGLQEFDRLCEFTV